MADPKTEQIATVRAEIGRLQAALAELECGFYTLTKADIGAGVIDAFGRKWSVLATLGTILPSDVGKRVYLRERDADKMLFLQAENDAQRAKRLGI